MYVDFVLWNIIGLFGDGVKDIDKSVIMDVILMQMYRSLCEIYLFCCVVRWVCVVC